MSSSLLSILCEARHARCSNSSYCHVQLMPWLSWLIWCRNGALPAAAESCKKGTLKLDLLSLTVGVAVVSMSHWLLQARSALLHDNASPLDAARKLAVVNGLGEHSRAQVCCAGLQAFCCPSWQHVRCLHAGRLQCHGLSCLAFTMSVREGV